MALSGSVGDVSLYHSALAPDDIGRLAKPGPGAVYAYVLDANGNVKTEPGLTPTTYTYTLDGRVRSSTSGGGAHTYTLDGAGNRVADAVTGSLGGKVGIAPRVVLGEQHAAVDEEQPAVDLEAGHVPAHVAE